MDASSATLQPHAVAAADQADAASASASSPITAAAPSLAATDTLQEAVMVAIPPSPLAASVPIDLDGGQASAQRVEDVLEAEAREHLEELADSYDTADVAAEEDAENAPSKATLKLQTTSSVLRSPKVSLSPILAPAATSPSYQAVAVPYNPTLSPVALRSDLRLPSSPSGPRAPTSPPARLAFQMQGDRSEGDSLGASSSSAATAVPLLPSPSSPTGASMKSPSPTVGHANGTQQQVNFSYTTSPPTEPPIYYESPMTSIGATSAFSPLPPGATSPGSPIAAAAAMPISSVDSTPAFAQQLPSVGTPPLLSPASRSPSSASAASHGFFASLRPGSPMRRDDASVSSGVSTSAAAATPGGRASEAETPSSKAERKREKAEATARERAAAVAEGSLRARRPSSVFEHVGGMWERFGKRVHSRGESRESAGHKRGISAIPGGSALDTSEGGRTDEMSPEGSVMSSTRSPRQDSAETLTSPMRAFAAEGRRTSDFGLPHQLQPPLSASSQRQVLSLERVLIQITEDNERFSVVDVSGLDSAAAIKERMLSKLHIFEDDHSSFALYRTEIGQLDVAGPSLDDDDLLAQCLQLGDDRGSLKFLLQQIAPPRDSRTVPSPPVAVSSPRRALRELPGAATGHAQACSHSKSGSLSSHSSVGEVLHQQQQQQQHSERLVYDSGSESGARTGTLLRSRLKLRRPATSQATGTDHGRSQASSTAMRAHGSSGLISVAEQRAARDASESPIEEISDLEPRFAPHVQQRRPSSSHAAFRNAHWDGERPQSPGQNMTASASQDSSKASRQGEESPSSARAYAQSGASSTQGLRNYESAAQMYHAAAPSPSASATGGHDRLRSDGSGMRRPDYEQSQLLHSTKSMDDLRMRAPPPAPPSAPVPALPRAHLPQQAPQRPPRFGENAFDIHPLDTRDGRYPSPTLSRTSNGSAGGPDRRPSGDANGLRSPPFSASHDPRANLGQHSDGQLRITPPGPPMLMSDRGRSPSFGSQHPPPNMRPPPPPPSDPRFYGAPRGSVPHIPMQQLPPQQQQQSQQQYMPAYGAPPSSHMHPQGSYDPRYAQQQQSRPHSVTNEFGARTRPDPRAGGGSISPAPFPNRPHTYHDTPHQQSYYRPPPQMHPPPQPQQQYRLVREDPFTATHFPASSSLQVSEFQRTATGSPAVLQPGMTVQDTLRSHTPLQSFGPREPRDMSRQYFDPASSRVVESPAHYRHPGPSPPGARLPQGQQQHYAQQEQHPQYVQQRPQHVTSPQGGQYMQQRQMSHPPGYAPQQLQQPPPQHAQIHHQQSHQSLHSHYQQPPLQQQQQVKPPPPPQYAQQVIAPPPEGQRASERSSGSSFTSSSSERRGFSLEEKQARSSVEDLGSAPTSARSSRSDPLSPDAARLKEQLLAASAGEGSALPYASKGSSGSGSLPEEDLLSIRPLPQPPQQGSKSPPADEGTLKAGAWSTLFSALEDDGTVGPGDGGTLRADRSSAAAAASFISEGSSGTLRPGDVPSMAASNDELSFQPDDGGTFASFVDDDEDDAGAGTWAVQLDPIKALIPALADKAKDGGESDAAGTSDGALGASTQQQNAPSPRRPVLTISTADPSGAPSPVAAASTSQRREPRSAKSPHLRPVDSATSATSASSATTTIGRRLSFAHRDADWAPRPPPEQLYENLDEFFPKHDLDKPVLEMGAGAPTSPLVDSPKSDKSIIQPTTGAASLTATPARASRHKKSIRIVAQDRKRFLERAELAERRRLEGGLERRRSTKLWGGRVVEMTPGQDPFAALPSATSESPSSDPNAKPVFKWVKGDLIGKGTYGRVYLALNATTGEMIAVKQVELPTTASDREDSRQKGVVAALKSEIETLKDLDHPHIVSYLGFEETRTFLSIFLEYVPGGSVGSCLRKHGKLDEPTVKYFTYQILDGLSYLHERGVLHRDLKGDNLLLTLDGEIKISDFGSARISENIYGDVNTLQIHGSIYWIAPEVLSSSSSKGYSAKVDIWSLGCVVLEMLSGRRPWSDDEVMQAMFKIGAERRAPPIPADVRLSKAAAHFLRNTFEVIPDNRPTAARLLEHVFPHYAPGWSFTSSALYRHLVR